MRRLARIKRDIHEFFRSYNFDIVKHWPAGFDRFLLSKYGDVVEAEIGSHKGDHINLGFIIPFPGSKMYYHCVKKGIIKDKEDFIKNKIVQLPVYNMTEAMTDEEFKKLRKEVNKAVMENYTNIIPISIKKEKKQTYEIVVKCPFCSNIHKYKNCFIRKRMFFGVNLICRSCGYRYNVVSKIKKFGYNHYSKIRILRDMQLKVINLLKRK